MSRGIGYWLRAPHTVAGNLAVSAVCLLLAILAFVTVSTRSGAMFAGIAVAGVLRALVSD